jgi:hypothetical protein
MVAQTRNHRQLSIYAIALAFCALALLFGLWNGLERGHWQTIGLFAVTVTGANMAILLGKQLRKPHA